jgi:hypothetical protein
VNSLEYGEVEGEQARLWSWITDLGLRHDNVEPIMRGGRARGKSENETFNGSSLAEFQKILAIQGDIDFWQGLRSH